MPAATAPIARPYSTEISLSRPKRPAKPRLMADIINHLCDITAAVSPSSESPVL